RQTRAYQLLERGHSYASRMQGDRALEDFTEAATLRPDLPGAWLARGGLYENLRLYDLAAQDFAKAFEVYRSPEASVWSTHAFLRLYVRDFAGYRQACSEMMTHFGDKRGARNSWWLAETCSLGLDSGVDPAILIGLAQNALLGDPKSTTYALTL